MVAREISSESIEEIIDNLLTDHILWIRSNPDKLADQQYFGYSTLFIILGILDRNDLISKFHEIVDQEIINVNVKALDQAETIREKWFNIFEQYEKF